MGFLKKNINKIILLFFGITFCGIILKKIFDPNLSKYKYFDQYCNGRVISNSYDLMTHFNVVKSSDGNKIYLEDLKIISLIKIGDSIIKNKNATYLTVYKKNNTKVIYDMYNKKLKVVK
ncbi:hypothetical protein SAMN06265171_1172 [Chryseobacterium rhizoplanae]|uniref:Uncharacterized protein n=1 Tax=Chryseobacterium rhizoplanae TaxID=1609531 RepID=A0A521FJX6_9FLAO|nr:hypothetical protein [Chryseobacterium rhizoplanae]SMO96522.1 hypothetical protein SAMN06265171_1172 [Chryseobacterium rhizoplanae]